MFLYRCTLFCHISLQNDPDSDEMVVKNGQKGTYFGGNVIDLKSWLVYANTLSVDKYTYKY